jgi:hypothetical protein
MFKTTVIVFVASYIPVALNASAAMTDVTIRDVVYDLDGNAFDGTVTFAPNGFEPSSTPATVSIPIRDGFLSVNLSPTNGSTKTYYWVTFTSRPSSKQWMEKWSIPPSSHGLYLKDVRIESPMLESTGHERDLSLPLPTSDIANLNTSLSQIEASLSALNTQVDQITSAIESLTSTARVLGETPSGLINGINDNFVLSNSPISSTDVSVNRNGLTLKSSIDYNVSGNTITFFPCCVPISGDTVTADYTTAAGSRSSSAHLHQRMRDITLPIPISGVTGLSGALAQLNQSLSTVTGTVNSLQNTVQNLAGLTLIYGDTLTGTINGSNGSFTLSASPTANGLALFKNGLRQTSGLDYSWSGQTVVFSSSATPQIGDILRADYQSIQ